MTTEEHLRARLNRIERIERLQNRRAELAIKLLKALHHNPNLLSGRRRIRIFLRTHWNIFHDNPQTDHSGELG